MNHEDDRRAVCRHRAVNVEALLCIASIGDIARDPDARRQSPVPGRQHLPPSFRSALELHGVRRADRAACSQVYVMFSAFLVYDDQVILFDGN